MNILYILGDLIYRYEFYFLFYYIYVYDILYLWYLVYKYDLYVFFGIKLVNEINIVCNVSIL